MRLMNAMRYFTPESATRTLPLVKQISRELLGLQLDVGFRGDRIDALSNDAGLATSPAHAEELADMRNSLQEDRDRMLDILEELGKVGALVHSRADGAIDFPSVLDAREVRLCWKPGDEIVNFWHEVDESASRRRLIQGERFSDRVLSGSEVGSETSRIN